MGANSLTARDNMGKDTVRAAAVLTTGYVASSAFPMGGANQLQLLCDFTVGSSSGCQIKVEFSHNNSDWFQESIYELSGTDLVHTAVVRRINGTAALVISIPVWAEYYRASSLAVADGTSTSLAISGLRGNL